MALLCTGFAALPACGLKGPLVAATPAPAPSAASAAAR